MHFSILSNPRKISQSEASRYARMKNGASNNNNNNNNYNNNNNNNYNYNNNKYTVQKRLITSQ